MSEFTIIDRVLNIYHTIYSARSLYKLMSTYSEIQRNSYSFQLFLQKKLHLKSLRGLRKCVRFLICHSSEYL